MSNPPAAIVTGSSRGIGRAVALTLGRAGYAVTVNATRNLDAAEAVARQIRDSGGQAIAVQASVADPRGRQLLLDQSQAACGDLQVLVNNAGITSPGRQDLLDATEENWDLVFDTNLKGPFFLTQLAARQMVAAHQAGRISAGTIVNISSISAFAVSTNRADLLSHQVPPC